MQSGATPALRRDRISVLTGLGIVVVTAWAYLVLNARGVVPSGMSDMSGGMGMVMDRMDAMTAVQTWTSLTFVLTLVMWTAMMIAMMVPSALPMTLIYTQVARKAGAQDNPVAPTFVFVAGYVAVWAGFSVLATTAQWGLDRLDLLSSTSGSRDLILGSALLVASGFYQLTPAKRACLDHCRAPAHFISRHWRSGTTGALAMGARHGGYCLGCCWALMALLFVFGVMNLLWVAALAVFVLLEKTVPGAQIWGRVAGAAMAAAGVAGLIVAAT